MICNFERNESSLPAFFIINPNLISMRKILYYGCLSLLWGVMVIPPPYAQGAEKERVKESKKHVEEVEVVQQQKKRVNIRVLDASNDMPLAGATIMIKGTTTGVMTVGQGDRRSGGLIRRLRCARDRCQGQDRSGSQAGSRCGCDRGCRGYRFHDTEKRVYRSLDRGC